MHKAMRSRGWVLPILLALVFPELAMAAQPPPTKQVAAKVPVAKRVVDPRKATKPQRPPVDTAMRPYRDLVDDVRESTDEFRDDNVSSDEERDRLPEP